MKSYLTKEQFMNDMGNMHPDIEVIGVFVNKSTKIKCKCLTDGNIFDITPSSLYRGCGCSVCGRKRQIASARRTHNDFVKQLHDKNPNIEVVGKYERNHTKIAIRCKIDGNEWMAEPASLLGGYGCPICAKRKLSDIFSKSHDQFVSEIKAKLPNIEIIGKYKNAKSQIECKCLIDGHVWSTMADSLSQGQGCPVCGGHLRKTKEQFVNELKEVNPFIEVIGEYINTDTKIKCRCLNDGNVWDVLPHQLLRGVGCPKCRQSKGERIVELFLISKNIQYIKEYRFSDCRDKQPLPFDFYLPDINTCIEYDGQQHYKPFDRWGGNNTLQGTQRRDKIKNKYCISNGIKLIRVPYTIKNIEEYISKRLTA